MRGLDPAIRNGQAGREQRNPGMTLPFTCEKSPASGSRGVVVANAPLGTMAGSEMLAIGGNAVDAAVAALLTLTVVEPMMVGIAGGGIAHLRLADGRHVVIDALSVAGQGARADMFTPVSDLPDAYMETEGRRNRIGPSAVAVPGNLRGWFLMQQRYGRLPWADVVEPAIRAAARGFAVSPYLHGAILEHRADLCADPEMARMFLPDGAPLQPGARLVMGDYAESLRLIQSQGDAALHGGDLGRALADRLVAGGGHVTLDDLTAARAVQRQAILGTYRGHTIAGPPPPASSGVHVVEMLNMLESYDLRGMGFGSPDTMDLMARAIALAFEDRRQASGDPDFVDVPVRGLLDRQYLRTRAGLIGTERDMGPAEPGDPPFKTGRFLDGVHRDVPATSHISIVDRFGNAVSMTTTIESAFGSGRMVRGFMLNNELTDFSFAAGPPEQPVANRVEPGKRPRSSMAPTIVFDEDGKVRYVLGSPGGSSIISYVAQSVVALIDWGLDPQQVAALPHFQNNNGKAPATLLEAGTSVTDLAAELVRMGHGVTVTDLTSGLSIIAVEEGRLLGGADIRRENLAVGR